MRMTDDDIRIHSRFNWAMFDQERKLPAYNMTVADYSLNLTFNTCTRSPYVDNRLLAWWKAETMEH